MSELRLAAIGVKPGAALESQSGLQMLRPRIRGAWRKHGARGRVAAIVMHPAGNHYLAGQPALVAQVADQIAQFAGGI